MAETRKLLAKTLNVLKKLQWDPETVTIHNGKVKIKDYLPSYDEWVDLENALIDLGFKYRYTRRGASTFQKDNITVTIGTERARR